MKKHIMIIITITLTCMLLLVSLSPLGLANSASMDLNRGVIVNAETSTGGGYQLTIGKWQINGTLHGNGYLLEVTSAPNGTGTPCCCTFLPCSMNP
jgi:hypothetical protein